MIACYSYWCGGHRKGISDDLMSMQAVSLRLAKKHFEKVYLFCDTEAKDALGPGFDHVEVIFDDLPARLSSVWAISKLIAFEHICSLKKPFIHIDYDFFLWRGIPERIRKSRVFAAHNDSSNVFYDYGVAELLERCPNLSPLLTADSLPRRALNTGIFGGTDLDFISRYARDALNFVLDPGNDEFFFEKHLLPEDRWCPKHAMKSCIVEQYLLACACSFYGVIPENLICDVDAWPTEQESVEAGITHLMGARGDKKVMHRVRQLAKDIRAGQRPKLTF